MPLLSLAGQALSRVISAIFPPAPPRKSHSPFRVEPLERRDVPAQFAVQLLTPALGDEGTAGATFSGTGLALAAGETADNGALIVEAVDAATAVKYALVGSVTAAYQGQSASYNFSASTAGLSKGDHAKNFYLEEQTQDYDGRWRVGLEDLSDAGMQSLGVDWDYDDRFWRVDVREYQAPTIGGGDGLLARYYNSQDFTNIGLIRVDPLVNNNWGGGSPDSAIQSDHFSAQWTGQVMAKYTDAYTFKTLSDDGIRVWVNGELVIDNMTDHGTTLDSGTPIDLEAGQLYTIQIAYYENAGGAVASLWWEGEGHQPLEVIPQSQLYAEEIPDALVGDGTGLRVTYFNNASLYGTAAASQVDALLDHEWGGGSPAEGVNSDGFSARWEGWVQAQHSANYTFATTSDDGVRVWVNGELVIDHWTDHGPTTDIGAHDGAGDAIWLNSGQYYQIKVEYYENGGDATAKLMWSCDNQLMSVIPTSQLFPAPGPLPTVSIAPAFQSLTEGFTGSVTLTRSGDASQSLSVKVVLESDGGGHPDADWGSDFTISGTDLSTGTGTVTFAAGASSATLQVTTFDDGFAEGTEGFGLGVLADESTYSADGSVADVLIGDVQGNLAPAAVSDDAIYEAGPLSIDVLANDGDPDGDTVSVTAYTNPSAGAVTLNADGTFTYTPNAADPSGTDTFTYTVGDGSGLQSTATVTVYLSPLYVFDSLIYSAGAGDGTLSATVKRLGRADEEGEVSYATKNLTAYAGFDFEYTGGTLFFAPGDRSEEVTVQILDRNFFGYRSLHLTLSDPQDGVLSTSLHGAIGEIVGGDAYPNAGLPPEQPSRMGDPSVTLTREMAESRMKSVLEPGMAALGASMSANAVSLADPAQTGLVIDGTKVTTSSVQTLMQIVKEGRITKPDDPLMGLKLTLIAKMIGAATSTYSFASAAAATENIEYRVFSAVTMARASLVPNSNPPVTEAATILGLQGEAARYIKIRYTTDPKLRGSDEKYWRKHGDTLTHTDWALQMMRDADQYDAVMTAIAGKNAKGALVDCLGGLHMGYLVGAAEALGARKFRGLFDGDPFPAELFVAGPSFPFLKFDYDPQATLARAAYQDLEKISVDYGLGVARGQQSDDAKWLGQMAELRKKVSDYFEKSQVKPVTGDYVYFANSRFTAGVYQASGRVGENAIAVQTPTRAGVAGQTLFAGLGLTMTDEAGMKQKLKDLLLIEPDKVQTWVDAMAVRAGVIAAAAKTKNAQNQPMTPKEYARHIFDLAAASDIGIVVVGRPTLTGT